MRWLDEAPIWQIWDDGESEKKKKKTKGMEYNSMNKTKNDERKLIPTNEQK